MASLDWENGSERFCPAVLLSRKPMAKEKVNGEKVTSELKSMLDSPEFAKETNDLQKRGGDILGFWNEDMKTPLFFVPRSAKLSDSQIKVTPLRCSCLVEGIAYRNCEVLDRDGQVLLAKPGDLIGVWTKPGMKVLASSQGVKVAMAYIGEKDIGKPSPMKLYDIRSEEGGQPLNVSEDNRKYSTEEPNIPVRFPVPISGAPF